MRPSRRSSARPARLIVLRIALCVLLAGGLMACLGTRPRTVGVWGSPRPSVGSVGPVSPAQPPSPSASTSASAAPGQDVVQQVGGFPRSGPGTWQYADAQGPVLGAAGPLHRFRVAVETGIPYPVRDFTAKIEQTLGDPRSWIAGGTVRVQQVPGNAPAEFTIFLGTRQTSVRMCLAGGLNNGGYTSCRVSGQVIINLDRWNLSVPDYVRHGIPLETYRAYLINHEIGHQFGHGHELCPAAGRPAPVMQQQTLGLQGCTANAWPFLNGIRYAGPPTSRI
jgi:hypothetical protein